MLNTEGRHSSTAHIAQYFTYEHLSREDLKAISRSCNELAEVMLAELSDNPELTAGLRKLLEAKDCFVRAAL